MFDKEGLMTKKITEEGKMRKGKRYTYGNLKIGAVLRVAGFKIKENVLVSWKRGEVKIARYKQNKEIAKLINPKGKNEKKQ